MRKPDGYGWCQEILGDGFALDGFPGMHDPDGCIDFIFRIMAGFDPTKRQRERFVADLFMYHTKYRKQTGQGAVQYFPKVRWRQYLLDKNGKYKRPDPMGRWKKGDKHEDK